MQQQVPLHVFVSTHLTQGQRANDQCFAQDGEILVFPSENGNEEVDGPSPARRSLRGIVSFTITTTFQVVEYTAGFAALISEMKASLDQAGETRLFGEAPMLQLATSWAESITSIASQFPVGAVVERRGNEFVWRGPSFDKETRIPVYLITPLFNQSQTGRRRRSQRAKHYQFSAGDGCVLYSSPDYYPRCALLELHRPAGDEREGEVIWLPIVRIEEELRDQVETSVQVQGDWYSGLGMNTMSFDAKDKALTFLRDFSISLEMALGEGEAEKSPKDV